MPLALEESRSLLRATLDATIDGILVVDRDGAVVAYNQPFAALWGIPAAVLATGADEQLLASVLDQLEDPAAWLAKVRALYADPMAHSRDEFRLRDGRVFERRSQPRMLRDEAAGRVWCFRDVTTERQAAAALAQSEQRLRAVFEHGDVGMAELAPDGRFLSANRTLCRMTGYALAELLTMRFQQLSHPDDLTADLALRDAAIARGDVSFAIDKRCRRKDGSVLWIHLTVAIIRDAGGALERVIPIMLDITEQRRAAAALALSERHLAEAQRTAHLGSWRLDLRTQLVESSPEHRRIYGLPADGPPVPAAWFRAACVDEDRQGAEASMGLALSTRQPGSARYRIRRSDGSLRHVEVRVAFAPGGEPGDDEMLGTTQDVTEHEAMQAQLAVADRLASLGSMAAGVAHEINNPLAALLGNLEMVTQAVTAIAGGDGVRVLLHDMTAAAERLRDIGRDLRLFSRAEPDTLATVELAPILESTLRLADNELRHRAQIVRQFGPAPAVRGNPSRLGQVFLNLIINAAQAIEEGHAADHRITITTATDADGRAVIEIADTGCGIAADQLPNLFRPFFTTKAPGLGTGLGLTICQRIVAELSGEITVDSTPGVGTRFRVALPPAQLPIAVAAPPPPPPPVAATPRARVLVIDDERMVGEVVRRALATAHDVTVTTEATEALRWLRGGERFDVILCDLMMPAIGGHEFYRALAEVAPEQQARVVFMTGGAFSVAAREFLDSVAHLDKPLDLRRLRATVSQVAAAPPR